MKHLSIVIIVLFITACVSVTLKTEPTKPAEGIAYQQPADPFENAGDKKYPSWIQKKTGNVISIFSECSSQDVSLSQLQNDALAALDEAKIVREEKIKFENHDALKTWIEGKTNGIDSKLLVVNFKKSNCGYTISYGGRNKSFNKDLPAFDQFIASLRIP